MSDTKTAESARLLDPVDRISEALFGLIMAVTIVGSLSIASAGQAEVRLVLIGALGCNLAWGLVDAVMYLVRTLVERTRNRTLAARIVNADASTARELIASTLPEHVAALTGTDELEGMRRRLLAARPSDMRSLGRDDFLAAAGIFLFVVAATFPVVLPFLLIADAALAMRASRIVTLFMLFVAGYLLGRHAGHARPALFGAIAALFGAVLILAVMALGG